jgi:superfamily II DNA or RNA helicase
MDDDFKSYGNDQEVHVIHSGKEKETNAKIVIGTWQSLHKLPKPWFQKFGCVIVDEAHLATSKSITSIMERMDSTKLRFGFTGTIDDSKCNALVLQGLFGEIYKAATTADLIEKKVLSSLKIECITIKYPESERKDARTLKYEEEMDFLVRHPKRNAVIRNLATKLPGNTLILFQFVEKHGKVLYEQIKASTDRPVFYISGEIKPKEREEIRKRMNTEKNAILVASAMTTSTGINIVELKNIIFASPSKAKIRTLQAIGRVLRRSETKTEAILFDIADDLTHKKRQNFTLKHFIERLKIYNREKFEYKVRSLEIGEKQK